MKNTTLIEYLGILSPAKIKKLRQFLLLFLAEKTQCIILFDALCIGLKKQKKLEADYILATVFKQTINDISLRSLTSRLLSYTENFLVSLQLHTEIRPPKKNTEKEFIILKYLKETKLDDLYFKRLDSLVTAYKKENSNNIWHTLEYMRLKHDAYYNKRDFTKNKTDKKGEFSGLLGLLDNFYDNFSGRYYLESLVRSKITQEKAILPVFYKKNVRTPSLYWKLIALFESGKNDELFEEIRANFELNFDIISDKDQHETLLYLINYTIRRVREDDMLLRWTKAIFELYDFGDKKNIFKNSGISTNGFSSAVTVASCIEKTKWAKKFILKHEGLLPKKEKQSSLLFANMYILFTEKKYNEVIELYYNQSYKDYSSELRFKSILLFSKYKSFEFSEEEVTTLCNKEYNLMQKNTIFSASFKAAATNFFNCIKAFNKKNDSVSKIKLKIKKRPLLMQFWLKKELLTYKPKK